MEPRREYDPNVRKAEDNDIEKERFDEFDFGEILPDDPQEKTMPSSGNDEMQRSAAYSQRQQQDQQKKKHEAQRRLKKIRSRRTWWGISVGILTWIKDGLLVVLILWLLTTYLASFFTVDSQSMIPKMKPDERAVAIKFSYHFQEPARGDVIEFTDKEGKNHVSRIIGLPADVINIDQDGTITVNDLTFKTTYCQGVTVPVADQVSYPVTVPDNCYFVLNDNGQTDGDSRYAAIGEISKGQIIGKVLGIFWPYKSVRPVN